MDYIINLLQGSFVFICIILFHDYIKTKTTMLLGDDSALFDERDTFSVFRSFDLIGLFICFSFGFLFGWSRTFPVDMNHFYNKKTGVILLLLSGIGSLFFLLFVSLLFLKYELYAPMDWYFVRLAMMSASFILFQFFPLPQSDAWLLYNEYMPSSLKESWLAFSEHSALYFFVFLIIDTHIIGIFLNMYSIFLSLFVSIFYSLT
ncbi:hypothetical protein COB57_02400 [Candidatus Peregrinibacteria bacterium]|nr:MAG: hypothetical protein COB57_02400 [Candidatus Peregrinibacteria bacterium]